MYPGLVSNRIKIGVRSDVRRIVLNNISWAVQFKIEEHMESRIYVNVYNNVMTDIRDKVAYDTWNERVSDDLLNRVYGKVTL